MSISKEHISNLSPSLSAILKSELSLGNEIVETSKGWPKKESILVLLRYSFKGNYDDINLEFRELNDPHYWKTEYCDPLNGHVLASGFESV